ncbi:hypothetical protein SAMN05216489_06217 [Streptomyces sp. 3213]|nr:hypothetical protein SAMN05216489_06217 [Streptomyces sp. 3213] [Streptomyces sp. 3213.3]
MMTASCGGQGARKPGERAQAVGAVRGSEGRPVTAVRADAVVPVLRLMLGLDDLVGNSGNGLVGVAG